jgi:hypothetical protein
MPWASDAQRRWGNSPSGHKALGDKGVAEFNAASKGKDLPEKVKHPHGNDMPMRMGEHHQNIHPSHAHMLDAMTDKRR